MIVKAEKLKLEIFFSLQLELAIFRDDLIDELGYFLQHSGLTKGTSVGPHGHVAQRMKRIKYFCNHKFRTCIDKYLHYINYCSFETVYFYNFANAQPR